MAEFLNLVVRPLFTWKHSELLFFISWPLGFLGNILQSFGTCKHLSANLRHKSSRLSFRDWRIMKPKYWNELLLKCGAQTTRYWPTGHWLSQQWVRLDFLFQQKLVFDWVYHPLLDEESFPLYFWGLIVDGLIWIGYAIVWNLAIHCKCKGNVI